METLSIGRNRIEIEEMMGAPEGRSLDGGNGYLWDYRRPVYDEASDTVYAWSLISFKFLKGLCAYVNIRLENPPVQLIQDPAGEKLPVRGNEKKKHRFSGGAFLAFETQTKTNRR